MTTARDMVVSLVDEWESLLRHCGIRVGIRGSVPPKRSRFVQVRAKLCTPVEIGAWVSSSLWLPGTAAPPGYSSCGGGLLAKQLKSLLIDDTAIVVTSFNRCAPSGGRLAAGDLPP